MNQLQSTRNTGWFSLVVGVWGWGNIRDPLLSAIRHVHKMTRMHPSCEPAISLGDWQRGCSVGPNHGCEISVANLCCVLINPWRCPWYWNSRWICNCAFFSLSLSQSRISVCSPEQFVTTCLELNCPSTDCVTAKAVMLPFCSLAVSFVTYKSRKGRRRQKLL